MGHSVCCVSIGQGDYFYYSEIFWKLNLFSTYMLEQLVQLIAENVSIFRATDTAIILSIADLKNTNKINFNIFFNNKYLMILIQDAILTGKFPNDSYLMSYSRL